jgi:phosphohistidine phosphatase
MRLLTLIRHAKSSWDDPELSDFERPLNARGRRDAPEMARGLAIEMERPLKLVSSPALRAMTTAHVFAEALSLKPTDIRIEPRIYEATPGTLLDVVNTLDNRDPHVVLFGHNPGFTELAQLLADVPFDEMPTCAVVTLQFDKANWHELVPRSGKVLRYRYPKQIDTAE